MRDGRFIFEGFLTSLKRFKNSVREVAVNTECGIGISDFDDFQPGDIIQVYQKVPEGTKGVIMDCVFCRISQDKTPAKKIYQDNDIIAFHDINPQAPVHVLIISRRHLTNLLDVNSQDESLIGRMLVVATQVAKKLNVSETGFRIVINTNKDAGQSIDHLHIHLLGGRKMQWPPG